MCTAATTGKACRADEAAEFTTVKKTADRLGVSPWAIYRAVGRGELRAVRFGGRILIPLRVLDELVARGAPTGRPSDRDATHPV